MPARPTEAARLDRMETIMLRLMQILADTHPHVEAELVEITEMLQADISLLYDLEDT